MFKQIRKSRHLLPFLLFPAFRYNTYQNDFKQPYASRVTIENPLGDRKILYPRIQTFNSGYLKVSDIHTIYYEECGNPNGKPVVILHGGPGGGISEGMRRFHNPDKYRIILFDQRGCGKSTPSACLEQNTTWDLVEDIEKLRVHLGVSKWQVFGGSWGSTLSLAYAQTHPEKVTELVLRGIFMLRREELEFFYQHGSSYFYPEYFEHYKAVIHPDEQHDLISAYRKIFMTGSQEKQREAALAWTAWEMATAKLFVSQDNIQKAFSDQFAEQFAKIENHYFFNRGFFKTNAQLLENADRIKHIPTVIVQGRYDLVCPMKSAWDLHKVLPQAELKIIPDAGHASMEQGTLSELVRATDKFSQ